mmetsp:Transcript_41249/g.123133  ORF Transcript_41249/g.123133 Transcript_41249/m.123133 type:complete len:103 (-) Transcript_41249:260-568(-)
MLEPPAAPKTTAQRAGAASAQSVERVAAMPPLPLTLPPPLTPLVLLLLLLLLLSLLALPLLLPLLAPLLAPLLVPLLAPKVRQQEHRWHAMATAAAVAAPAR